MVHWEASLYAALALPLVARAQTTEYLPVTIYGSPPAGITINETFVFTCPAPLTVYVNETALDITTTTLAEIFTVTTTTIATTTAVELFTDTTTASTTATVEESFTSTTDLFFTDTTTASTTIFVTLTTPTTITATVTTPTTLTTPTTITVTTPTTITVTTPTTITSSTSTTETEIISEHILTSTTTYTTLTICPTRTLNPTWTYSEPLPTDWTWGCPPGWLCRPQQNDCNFEAGIPADDFYCAPNECELATTLPAAQLWNTDIYGNFTPLNDPALRYNAVDHYFNQDPTEFGLSYDIFVVTDTITWTSTTTIFEGPTPTGVKARQAITSVPTVCYPWCNNCLLEAQANGKVPALCEPGSAFETDLGSCESCISAHKNDAPGQFVQIAPQFQQFLNYCAKFYTTTYITGATTLVTVVPTGSSITQTTAGGTPTITSVPIASTPPPSPTVVSTPVTIISASTSTSTAVAVSTGEGSTVPTASTTEYLASTSTVVVGSPTTVLTPVSASTPVSPSESSPASESTPPTTPASTGWTSTTIPQTSLTEITIILTYGSITTTISGPTVTGVTLIQPVTGGVSGTSTLTLGGGSTGAASTATQTTPPAPNASGTGTATGTASASAFTGAASSTKFDSLPYMLSVFAVAAFMLGQ